MAIKINANGDRYVGLNIVFGAREPKPIYGAPPGAQRLRMSNKSAAKLFVKTENSIRLFLLEDHGDRWFCSPRLEQAAAYKFEWPPHTINSAQS